MAGKCKFTCEDEVNIRLTEQLIIGTVHTAVQEKLLEIGGKLNSLDKAINIAQTCESTKTQLAQMQGARQEASNSGQIHVIMSKKSTRKTPEPACQRCGKQHECRKEACPAHQQK